MKLLPVFVACLIAACGNPWQDRTIGVRYTSTCFGSSERGASQASVWQGSHTTVTFTIQGQARPCVVSLYGIEPGQQTYNVPASRVSASNGCFVGLTDGWEADGGEVGTGIALSNPERPQIAGSTGVRLINRTTGESSRCTIGLEP